MDHEEHGSALNLPSALRAIAGGHLGRDIWSTVGGNGVGALAAFLAGLVLARWLGPTDRGRFEVALFVVNAAVLLLSLGLNIPTAVFMERRRASGVWAYRSGVGLMLLYSIVIIPASLLVLPRMDTWRASGLSASLVLAGFAAFLAVNLVQLTTAVASGSGRIRSINYGVVTRWLTYLIGLLILQATVSPSPESALAWFASSAMLGCTVIWLGLRNVDRSTTHGTIEARRLETLAFGLRGQTGNVLQFLSYRFDVMLVSLWVGQAALGVYAVGVLFAEALWLVPNALGTVLLSHTARSSKEDADRRIRLVFPVACWVVITGGALLSAVAWFAPRAYLGSAYAQVPWVTWALMPGALALSGTKILSNDLTARGYPGINTVIAGCAMIITVIGDILLIPKHGIIGAAIASSIGYGASLGLTFLAFRDRVGIRVGLSLPGFFKVPVRAPKDRWRE
jgi:O-antigen/teichoic acid export membrane protein